MLIIIVIFVLLFNTISGKHPNVIFIIVDDLRPSLKCYGDQNAYTPNVDKLASRSFIFNNAFAQQAVCGPSRTSFLTSRRPDSLHLYNNDYSYWRSSVGNFTTIPQFFKQNGYYTYSVGKVFHPGKLSNFTDDFPYSWSVKTFHPKTEQFKNSKVCIDKNGELAENLVCPVITQNQPEGTLPDLESLTEAIRFLKYRDTISDKPYFLAVGFHKPHIPLKFPIQYLDNHPIDNITLPANRWRPSSLPDVAWNPWNDVRSRDDIKQLNVPFPYGPMPDEITKRIKQAYYASVTYIDDLIGQLLRYIDKNTIIVFLGDHGWSIGEHGEFAKYSNFDVATKVPLLIHVPGLSETEVIYNNPVELVDLFPTLVDLTQVSQPVKTCSVKKPDVVCTEGRSLVPHMIQKKRNLHISSTSAFSQYPRPGLIPTLHPDSDLPEFKDITIMGYSIRTDRFRYTEWVKFSTISFKPNWDVVYGRELYDHSIDPDENNNIVDRDVLHNITRSLRKKLILGWRYA